MTAPAHITREEARALLAKPKRHKYGARKVECDGIVFDSEAEARRYGELKLLEQAGEIRDLTMQPRFPFIHNDILIGKYVADFQYWTVPGGDSPSERVVEDVKGYRSGGAYALFRFKARLLRAFYGIAVTEVS